MKSSDRNSDSNRPMLLLVIGLAVVVHVLLSVFGLVPTEVSEFNQQLKRGVGKLGDIHRLTYERPARPILPRSSVAAADRQQVIGSIPSRIVIDKIGVDVEVKSPEEASISTLDAALQEGAVHYPGSGGIGGERRMFLFGHSSRLPVVQNEAYQTFNGLNQLEPGDEIEITAEDGSREVYVVTAVEVADQSDRLVSLESGEGKLTLSTCTTFGARENRVVVDAELKST